MTFLSTAVTIFLVMDPLGNVPIFLSLLEDVPSPARRRAILLRESLIALGVLVLFLLCGPMILKWLSVETLALRIAGGVVLFLIAMRILFPSRQGVAGNNRIGGEPLIVPIAIPLIAGPSAIATVMLLTSQQQSVGRPLAAVLLAWLVGLGVFMVSEPLARRLGPRGMAACQRLMGLLLTVVAVQMLLTGLRLFIQDLPTS